MTEFTIATASGPSIIRVNWSDETHNFWFLARVEGDDLGELLKGSAKFPVVYRQPHGISRTSSYLDARDEPWASLVTDARIAIYEGRLATAAKAARDAARAERERQRIKDRANAFRNALAQIGASLAEPVEDRLLADAFDTIQGSAL